MTIPEWITDPPSRKAVDVNDKSFLIPRKIVAPKHHCGYQYSDDELQGLIDDGAAGYWNKFVGGCNVHLIHLKSPSRPWVLAVPMCSMFYRYATDKAIAEKLTGLRMITQNGFVWWKFKHLNFPKGLPDYDILPPCFECSNGRWQYWFVRDVIRSFEHSACMVCGSKRAKPVWTVAHDNGQKLLLCSLKCEDQIKESQRRQRRAEYAAYLRERRDKKLWNKGKLQLKAIRTLLDKRQPQSPTA